MRWWPTNGYLAVVWLAVLASVAMGGNLAWAEPFPARQLTIIHGGVPGSSSDLISRSVAAHLAERLGKGVIAEPKPGVEQSVAMAAVANARPDGHTIALLNADIGVRAAVSPMLSYDARRDFAPLVRIPSYLFHDLRRDFAPIGMISSSPIVFAVRADGPYKNVQELIDAARLQPGKLRFGAISGTTPHLTGELFATTAGIRWNNVPYTTSAAARTDLLGGHLDAVVDSLSSLTAPIQAGEVRALAVSSAKRWPTLPYVPAMSETLPGFDVTSWTGLAVPVATPVAVRARLERELAAIVVTDTFATLVRRYGSEPFNLGPADMTRVIDEEVRRWSAVARNAGIASN